MKRSPHLHLSRRGFCGLAGLGALVACTDGHLAAIETGGLGSTPDAPMPPPDANGGIDGVTGTCSGAEIDVGPASSFQVDSPVFFSSGNFFVVRDAQGLYALTAACTHEGRICDIQSGDIHCPRHGALFTLDGAVISGPVSVPLAHFAMCTLASGHVGVLATQVVPASTRLTA